MGGPVRWFIDNPIAANLLMVFLIVGGLFGLRTLDKQFFPDFELNLVNVTMSYPGAGPSEVEEQICVRIEEAVHDLPGIQEIRSTARQGHGQVRIEAEKGYDIERLTADVKTRVDAINTFPEQAERPVINQVNSFHHMGVATIAGDIGERNLKELGERLRDDLASQPHVSLVDLASPRPYEVSVEVSEYTLRRYGLNFSDVVSAIWVEFAKTGTPNGPGLPEWPRYETGKDVLLDFSAHAIAPRLDHEKKRMEFIQSRFDEERM